MLICVIFIITEMDKHLYICLSIQLMDKQPLTILPVALQKFLAEAGELTQFTGRFFKEGILPPYEWRELLKQCFLIGNKSLPLVGFTTFIIGLVFTMQSRPTLQMFGAESWVPAMVGISIVREIGPILAALICSGKVGSGIGAELGSMKVTEQIDAMEVSGVNPFKYIVSTRIVACTLMLPILTICGDAVALYGSFIAVNIQGVLTFKLFFKQVFEHVEFGDIVPAIIKTFFFGFVIGLIGCYQGYNSKKGTEGVGRSANTAVVVSSLLVFVIDLIAVQITQFFGLI